MEKGTSNKVNDKASPEDISKYVEFMQKYSKRLCIFEEVNEERERQHDKWGEQNHDPITWCVILGEEVGEVNKAAYEAVVLNWGDIAEYRKELVQTAAVCFQMIECLDRNSAPNP